MASLIIEQGPAAEPLTVAFVKNALKLPSGVTSDDELISMLIQSSREQAEAFTGRSLVNKRYRQSLDSFPYFADSMFSQQAYPPSYYALPRYATTMWNYSQLIKLLRAPLQEITGISYTDSASGEIRTLKPALFAWLAKTDYVKTEQIEDSNGNIQEVTAYSSTPDSNGKYSSGASEPTWATGTGTTNDSGLIWTCRGAAPDGDFIYDADSTPPRLFPLAGGNWPPVLYVPNAVQVHFVAGYGDDGKAVPAGIKTAMLQLITDWYFNREPVAPGSVCELPNHVKSLLWTHRILDYAPTRG